MTHAWETAVLYHLVHACALLAVSLSGVSSKGVAPTSLKFACLAWSLGVVLFSGSLYWLALGGPKILGPVTPLGGVFLIAGWAGLFWAALKNPAKKA